MAWLGFYSWGMCVATQDLYAHLQKGLEVRWLTKDDQGVWQAHKHSWEKVITALKDGEAPQSPTKQSSLRDKLTKQHLDAKTSDCLVFRALLSQFNSPDVWLRWQQEAHDVTAVQALYAHWKDCSDVGGLDVRTLLAVSQTIEALMAHLKPLERCPWWCRWWLGHVFFERYLAQAHRMLAKLIDLQSQCATYACRFLVSEGLGTIDHPMKHWVDGLRRAGVESIAWPAHAPSDRLSAKAIKGLTQLVAGSSHAKRLMASYSGRDLAYGVWAGQWMPLPAEAVPMLAAWPESVQQSAVRAIEDWVWRHYVMLDACSGRCVQGLIQTDSADSWERLVELNHLHANIQAMQHSMEQEKARGVRSKHREAQSLRSVWLSYLNETLQHIDSARRSCVGIVLADTKDHCVYWMHHRDHMETYLAAVHACQGEITVHASAVQSAEQCRVIHSHFGKPVWTHDDCVYLSAFFKSHPLDRWLMVHKARLQSAIHAQIKALCDGQTLCPDGVERVRSLQLLVDLACPMVGSAWLSEQWQQITIAYLRAHEQAGTPSKARCAHLALLRALLMAYMADDLHADPGLSAHWQAVASDTKDPLWWSRCVQTAQKALQGLYQQWMLGACQGMQGVIEANLKSGLRDCSLEVAHWLPWVQRVAAASVDSMQAPSNMPPSEQVMMQRIASDQVLPVWMRMHGIFSGFANTWCDQSIGLMDQWVHTVSCMRQVQALDLQHDAITWWLAALTALVPAEHSRSQTRCEMRGCHDHP